MTEDHDEKLSLVSVIAIGMGGMIGAGIFALLGLAVSIAGGGVWMAFLLGGAAAVAGAYSFSHLALAYPSRGGAATYVNRAYASSMLAGSLNVLLWLGYVVVLSLYAHAFGAYGARLMGLPVDGLAAHAVMTGSVAVFTVLNLVGARVVGRAESLLVYAKVLVLAAFAGAGLFSVRAERVSFEHGALAKAKDYALAVAAGGIGGSWAFNAIAVTAIVRRPVLSTPPSTERRG